MEPTTLRPKKKGAGGGGGRRGHLLPESRFEAAASRIRIHGLHGSPLSNTIISEPNGLDTRSICAASLRDTRSTAPGQSIEVNLHPTLCETLGRVCLKSAWPLSLNKWKQEEQMLCRLTFQKRENVTLKKVVVFFKVSSHRNQYPKWLTNFDGILLEAEHGQQVVWNLYDCVLLAVRTDTNLPTLFLAWTDIYSK